MCEQDFQGTYPKCAPKKEGKENYIILNKSYKIPSITVDKTVLKHKNKTKQKTHMCEFALKPKHNKSSRKLSARQESLFPACSDPGTGVTEM